MADPYRKTQPGQPLKVSSRAWNRILDGVHGKNVPMGQGFIVPTLPAIRGMMQWQGETMPTTSTLPRAAFGQVWEIKSQANYWSGDVVEPDVPIPESWEPSAAESSMFRYALPEGVPVFAETVRRNTSPFAICCSPERMEFVFAGFAWTRVRVFASSHRHARLPGRYEDTTEQQDEVRGCLDSCFFGPARIVGYLGDDAARPRITDSIPAIDFPDYRFLWALVRF